MGIFNFLKPRSRSGSRQRSGKSVKKVEVKPTPKKEPVKVPAPKKRVGEVYKILKEPHVSEKATQLSDENKYTFKVFFQANKIEIKKAISNLYGVKVKNVRIINIKPKKRILRGKEGTKTGYKKAIITLEKGYKIEIMPH